MSEKSAAAPATLAPQHTENEVGKSLKSELLIGAEGSAQTLISIYSDGTSVVKNVSAVIIKEKDIPKMSEDEKETLRQTLKAQRAQQSSTGQK